MNSVTRWCAVLCVTAGLIGCGGGGGIEGGFPEQVSGPAPGPPAMPGGGNLDDIAKGAKATPKTAKEAKKSGGVMMP